MSEELNFIPLKNMISNVELEKDCDIKIAFRPIDQHHLKPNPNYSRTFIDFGTKFFDCDTNGGINYFIGHLDKNGSYLEDLPWTKAKMTDESALIYDIVRVYRKIFYACGELDNGSGVLYRSKDDGKTWTRMFVTIKPIYRLSIDRKFKEIILYQDL